jgi:hypothetical protein
MNRIYLYLVAPAALLLIGLAVWPVQIVTVMLPKEEGRRIAVVQVRARDTITLRYRHSVERTWVEGHFAVGPTSELQALETRIESVGTGLPNAFPERTTKQIGWLVIDEGRKPMDSIRFFIVPINQTRLTVADHVIPLARLEGGSLIEVTAGKTSMIQWLLLKLRLKSTAREEKNETVQKSARTD